MPIEILQGLAIPFLGTTLGAACVFLLRGELDHRIQKAFTGFAAGIMVAAPSPRQPRAMTRAQACGAKAAAREDKPKIVRPTRNILR